MVDLCVVMPVLNESESIEPVITEWRDELVRLGIDHEFVVVDNGSTDGTMEQLAALAGRFGNVSVLSQTNSSHGQSCLYGYRAAIERSAQWIFQIDSDGQCDPRYFEQFWSRRTAGTAVQGFRKQRDDGVARVLVSRALSGLVFILSGKLIKDLNVPYRLMDAATLRTVVETVPADFNLANILLSYIYAARYSIDWIPIRFRRRFAGQSTLTASKLPGHAIELVRQLTDYMKRY